LYQASLVLFYFLIGFPIPKLPSCGASLSPPRSRLEQSLGLSYGELLQFLSQQLQSSVALAHVSGNVYLGPQLEDLKMSGEQVELTWWRLNSTPVELMFFPQTVRPH
jgi:hypothetical protein